jgi:uncharacterized protein YecE (DUF72 family)
MARVYTGTAGWSYDDWEGIVYPARHGSGFHPLTYLARYMDMVEVNSTFYRPPSLAASLSWVKKVAAFPDFLFAVKLHQDFTHAKDGATAGAADVFKRGIEPIAAAGRLAALLIQFPWSFANTPDNVRYLTALFAMFAGYPMALEVRHSSWDAPEFFSLLRERGVVYCNIDQPVIGKSLKPSAIATTKAFSYVRLHGRNGKDWFRKGAGRDDRYNYLYAKDELGEWVDRIKQLSNGSDRIFVVTNNHYRGQALANALQIKNMVTGEKLEIPPELVRQYPVLGDIVARIRKGQKKLFDDPGEEPDKG